MKNNKQPTNTNQGIIKKYIITRADGKPLPDTFEAFVLRIDEGAESSYRKASLEALKTFSREIKNTHPLLSIHIESQITLIENIH